MSRDHRAFAAELRADAIALRTMADALDARAAEHDHLAQYASERGLEHMAFCMNMTPEAYRAHLRRCRRGAPVYAEDVHDFRGTGHIGSAHRPELVLG